MMLYIDFFADIGECNMRTDLSRVNTQQFEWWGSLRLWPVLIGQQNNLVIISQSIIKCDFVYP